MPIQAEQDLSWIARSLDAACRRLNSTSASLEIVSAFYSPADDRLSCLVVAESWEAVRDLFEFALLPPARVLEVVKVEEPGPPVRPG